MIARVSASAGPAAPTLARGPVRHPSEMSAAVRAIIGWDYDLIMRWARGLRG